MKNLFSTSFRLFLVGFLFLVIPIVTSAQKLPEVQKTSLRAPAAIRIDGKAIEWNNQFQAYNKATEISYNMSNDNKNLYLVIKATDLDIINKIVCGGITLTINGTGKNKDQGGKTITFPAINIDNTVSHRGPPIGFLGMPQKMDDTEFSKNLIDSFIVFFNREITAKAKDIRIAGIKGITDTLISIYNPQGIKVASQIDKERAFICELAVPLTHLDLSLSLKRSFVYNIKLKGMNPDVTSPEALGTALGAQRGEILNRIAYGFRSNSNQTMFPPPQIVGIGSSITVSFPLNDGQFVIEGANAARGQNLIMPTHFSGEYTLAK